MAKAETRPEEKASDRPPPEPTPLERMTDLTRRIVQVPKEEAVRPKKRKRH